MSEQEVSDTNVFSNTSDRLCLQQKRSKPPQPVASNRVAAAVLQTRLSKPSDVVMAVPKRFQLPQMP